MLESRRYGKFYIHRSWLADYPELVRELLSGLIVVDATYGAVYDSIEYTAECDDFDEVPDGVLPIFYQVWVDSMQLHCGLSVILELSLVTH